MQKFSFLEGLSGPKKILALGAHADDIEIGCGGTILRLASKFRDLEVLWVVFSATGERAAEARVSADAFLAGAAHTRVIVRNHRDGFLPYSGAVVKEEFETLKQEFAPDLVFTHCRDDLHQDHRLISELTWNTFRNHLILEYEIPKYDGDIGTPNLFVHLDGALCKRKVDNILRCFGSQRGKAWFSEDTFYAMLRLRGLESNAPEKYAEAFYCRKMVY
jgi:LmbE family N-acetylglucosaminyl deacetylase